ncbi:hypothetical protein C0J52_15236 [Blattella germanica]|nr:hypothetical protein C0J52_15236 [Blattella germanica]
MADRLAKKAAAEEGEIVFHKIPRDTIVSEDKIKSLQQWQLQWNESTKGPITRLFFPTIKERLKKNTAIGTQTQRTSLATAIRAPDNQVSQELQ